MHKAQCNKCKEIIISERCGHFVSCKCGASFIDTDRWFPKRYRLGGDCIGLDSEESTSKEKLTLNNK